MWPARSSRISLSFQSSTFTHRPEIDANGRLDQIFALPSADREGSYRHRQPRFLGFPHTDGQAIVVAGWRTQAFRHCSSAAHASSFRSCATRRCRGPAETTGKFASDRQRRSQLHIPVRSGRNDLKAVLECALLPPNGSVSKVVGVPNRLPDRLYADGRFVPAVKKRSRLAHDLLAQ